MIITIDGLAGTGKTTIAKKLANKIGFEHFDSGVLFRSIALYMINHNISMDNVYSNSKILDSFNIDYVSNDNGYSVFLENKDVTKRIRDKDVTELSTVFSKYEIVKQVVYNKIRNFAKGKDIVIDGRCMGNKILPMADIKFFFTSPLEIRAQRRINQFPDLGLSLEETIEQFKNLDVIEKEKGVLDYTKDTVVVNNTGIDELELLSQVYKIVNDRLEKVNRNKRRLRLLLTHNCNYRCRFCHNEGICEKKQESLNANDYEYLAKVAKENYNIDHINLSGGEPLIRPDIIDIVSRLKGLGLNIAMTTNGLLLGEKKDVCKYLDSINISFHSNNKQYYEYITNTVDTFEKVKNNIRAVRAKYPNVNIYLNVAYTKDVFENFRNVISMINFSLELNCVLKFIEIFPKTNPSYLNIDNLKRSLLDIDYCNCKDSIRKSHFIKGDSVIVTERCFCSEAFYKEDPKQFCQANNDLFVTSDGAVTLCRNTNDEVSLLAAVKSRDEDMLINDLQTCIDNLAKPCCCHKINCGE